MTQTATHTRPIAIPDLMLEPMVRAALAEDLGHWGDITTRTVVPADTRAEARIVARDEGVVSGMQVAAIAFRLVDPMLDIDLLIPDGARCRNAASRRNALSCPFQPG